MVASRAGHRSFEKATQRDTNLDVARDSCRLGGLSGCPVGADVREALQHKCRSHTEPKTCPEVANRDRFCSSRRGIAGGCGSILAPLAYRNAAGSVAAGVTQRRPIPADLETFPCLRGLQRGTKAECIRAPNTERTTFSAGFSLYAFRLLWEAAPQSCLLLM
jgi:hypothetical protein